MRIFALFRTKCSGNWHSAIMCMCIEIERKSDDTLRRFLVSFFGWKLHARLRPISDSPKRSCCHVPVNWQPLHASASHTLHSEMSICRHNATEFVAFFFAITISMQIHAFATLLQCKLGWCRSLVIAIYTAVCLKLAWARWLHAFAAICSCHILCIERWQRRWRTSEHTIEIKLQKNRTTK